jgi:hypothetical protein
VRDAAAALQALLVEGDPLPLAWQPSGEGAVIVATAGWRSEVFLPAEGVSLEMTPMVAFRLVRHEGEWYWRWFMPDVSGTLNRQRRDPGWRTLPG